MRFQPGLSVEQFPTGPLRRHRADCGDQRNLEPIFDDLAGVRFLGIETRAEQLGAGEPDHFIFPACECGVIDPTKPMKGWRTAWRHLTKEAGLKGLRFHDLRHQAITELCEAGLSDMTIMGIAGNVSWEILQHYSHIRLQARRDAVALLETPLSISKPDETAESVRPN